MTLEQYRQKEAEIKVGAIAALNELRKKYAQANNPYKVGDVFTDHVGSIEITSMQAVSSLTGGPCMLYDGYILTAKGERRKDGATRPAWQSNDINKK